MPHSSYLLIDETGQAYVLHSGFGGVLCRLTFTEGSLPGLILHRQ